MKNKFSVIVANPPYNGKLHLDIFEELVDKADKCVFIHPANWLQFPSRVKLQKIMEHAESFEIVDRKDANAIFDIDGGDLVISETNIVKPNKTFNWFEYHPFIQKTNVPTKMLESIMNKIISKCPAETCKNKFTKTPQTAFSCRCMPEANMGCTNNHGKNDKNSFLLMSQYYTTVCSTKYAKNVRYLNFNSEQERYNAWQSYLTKFARFCVAMDESTKYAPYMSDYTQPWTNQRFFDYFELDNLEQQLINTVIV